VRESSLKRPRVQTQPIVAIDRGKERHFFFANGDFLSGETSPVSCQPHVAVKPLGETAGVVDFWIQRLPRRQSTCHSRIKSPRYPQSVLPETSQTQNSLPMAAALMSFAGYWSKSHSTTEIISGLPLVHAPIVTRRCPPISGRASAVRVPFEAPFDHFIRDLGTHADKNGRPSLLQ